MSRFALKARVGRGAFGVVYRADDLETGREAAVKRLNRGLLSNPGARERFLREARLLARIQSPHVVTALAHGVDEGGRPWLALEWLEGQDLLQRQRVSPVSVDQAIEIARQAALGLE